MVVLIIGLIAGSGTGMYVGTYRRMRVQKAAYELLLAAQYFQVILGLADGYARLFVQAAKLYLIGAVALAIFYFMARQKLRLHWLRWAVLCAALGIDIFLGARYIVDTIL